MGGSMTTNDIAQNALLAGVLMVLQTQIRPLLAVHGGGVELIEVTSAGEVRLVFEGACRGCSLKSVTYVLGIRQKLMPIPGVTEVTVEGVRLSRAAIERAARMYEGYSPWVGAPVVPTPGI
jgi:Fe-S cluster biogenesis protein NfuA